MQPDCRCSCISVCDAGRDFILASEGDGDGSGNDGTRIPHDDELKCVAFQRSRKHLLWVCEGVSHVKI